MTEPTIVPLGRPRPERADAARNREVLLCHARSMIDELGADAVTMDGLAERAGLGKGTVFRRFGTRAGIFRALLDATEQDFQQRVLSGPPPLGPGAGPVERLVAYGRARVAFLADHQAVARAGMDRGRPVPGGDLTITPVHVRMLVGLVDAGVTDPEMLALQLTAALEGPLLLSLTSSDTTMAPGTARRLADSWQDLVERTLRR